MVFFTWVTVWAKIAWFCHFVKIKLSKVLGPLLVATWELGASLYVIHLFDLLFVIVKMDVTGKSGIIMRIESMCQSSAFPIKRIRVIVRATNEANANIRSTDPRIDQFSKLKVGHGLPFVKRTPHGQTHLNIKERQILPLSWEKNQVTDSNNPKLPALSPKTGHFWKISSPYD